MSQAVADKNSIKDLESFYAYVKVMGKLRTNDHAKRWTAGTLQMLGVNVSRGVKRSLKDQLPEDLAEQLGQVFWIAHFRNTNLSSYEFQNRVARRSRATSDPDFAKYPIQAIFGGLKSLINDSLVNEVRDDLSPELSAMWEQA